MYKKIGSLEFRRALRTTTRTTKLHRRHTIENFKMLAKGGSNSYTFLHISWHNCILMYLK